MSKQSNFLVAASLIVLFFELTGSFASTPEDPVTRAKTLVIQLSELNQKADLVRQDLDNNIDELARIGDPAIPVLMESFYSNIYCSGLRRSIVQVLQKIGSDSAKQQLIAVAVSKNKAINHKLKDWAATNYIKIMKNKEDALPLLDSEEMDVKKTALAAMPGIKLNRQSFSRLDALLDTEKPAIRGCVVSIYEKDPSEECYAQKIDSLLRVTDKVYTYKDAHKKQFGGLYNYAESTLNSYINALASMRGPLFVLQQASTKAKTPLAREICLIARADRKDTAVRNEMIAIIQNLDRPLVLRLRATVSMAGIGTKDDIPFLKKVAETDPYCEKDQQGCIRMPGYKYYRIREIAKESIREIQKR